MAWVCIRESFQIQLLLLVHRTISIALGLRTQGKKDSGVIRNLKLAYSKQHNFMNASDYKLAYCEARIPRNLSTAPLEGIEADLDV